MQQEFLRCSDAELVKASCKNPAAFEHFFAKYAEGLRGWTYAQVRDLDLAQEIVAESFARAWVARKRFRGEAPGSAWSWLRKIAYNLICQAHRKGKVQAKALKRLAITTQPCLHDGVEEMLDHLHSQELSVEIQQAFAKLTPEQKQAIRWNIVEARSYTQMAEEANCTEQVMRARCSRGMKTMREALTRSHEAQIAFSQVKERN